MLFRLSFLLLALVLSGCPLNSGIDAWEGILNSDIDQDGDIAGEETEGAAEELAYPEGVDQVFDLTVVGTTLWLWANDTGDDVDGPVLIPLSVSTGDVGNTIAIQDRPGLINAASELTWDGAAFWFTSDGNVSQAQLYQVERDGTVAGSITCPFAGVAECQGLAWDGSFLWTGEKNGTQVTRVSTIPGGVVPSPFSPWGDTSGTIDFLFAQETTDTSQALVVRDRTLYWIDSSSESVSDGLDVDFERGGANSGTIWYASDADRRIFTRIVPPSP